MYKRQVLGIPNNNVRKQYYDFMLEEYQEKHSINLEHLMEMCIRDSAVPVPTTGGRRFNRLPAICLLTIRFMPEIGKTALFISCLLYTSIVLYHSAGLQPAITKGRLTYAVASG